MKTLSGKDLDREPSPPSARISPPGVKLPLAPNLLDQFATHAMNGILSAMDANTMFDPDHVARDAYAVADAMMKHRELRGKKNDQTTTIAER